MKLDRAVERGALLEVERDALPPTEDDEYYAFELVGLPVVEETGRELGSVKAVTPGVANDVLELDSGRAPADDRGLRPRRRPRRAAASSSPRGSPDV